MSKKLAGRRVRMFRCERPPLIGGSKVLNAHMVKDLGWEAEFCSEGTAIIITNQNGTEFVVGLPNIQNAELLPEIQAEPVIELKPKLGRPFGSKDPA